MFHAGKHLGSLASILSYWVNQTGEALDLSDVTKLAALSKAYPKTGCAFRIVQAFDLVLCSPRMTRKQLTVQAAVFMDTTQPVYPYEGCR